MVNFAIFFFFYHDKSDLNKKKREKKAWNQEEKVDLYTTLFEIH